jgi:tetratricopeptide (TPR) repeat protein
MVWFCRDRLGIKPLYLVRPPSGGLLSDAFAAIKGDDADSREVRAEGRFRVGNMRYSLGELKEAAKDYDQALSILEQLAADLLNRPEFRQGLAGSHNTRGRLLYTTGRLKEAEKDYDQALSIQKQLGSDFPNRPEFRQGLARSHNNRGRLLYTTGRLKEAEEDLDQALSIRKQLVADFPSRPEFRQELASAKKFYSGSAEERQHWTTPWR